MIYVKIKTKLYTEEDLTIYKAKINKEYIGDYTSQRLKALVRIIKRELTSTLKDYPDIDIYIDNRKSKRILGRFTRKVRKNYKRIDNNPYIILYWSHIEDTFNHHNVKGLCQILLHEYVHFKRWLLNESQRHYSNLPRFANTNINNLDYCLKEYDKELNQARP